MVALSSYLLLFSNMPSTPVFLWEHFYCYYLKKKKPKPKSIVAAVSYCMSTYHFLGKSEFAPSMIQVNSEGWNHTGTTPKLVQYILPLSRIWCPGRGTMLFSWQVCCST